MIEILLGVATWYAGVYVGQPLYCGGTYDVASEWVALPMGTDWQCGDLIAVFFEGETAAEHDLVVARVYDTGPLGEYCVAQRDDCVPIVVDIPAHLWPGSREGDKSAAVRVVNVTAAARAARGDGTGDLGCDPNCNQTGHMTGQWAIHGSPKNASSR